ncbi:NADH:ubiquinone reductase (Na(+)-transporting) subunit C [Limibacter armeniacum]|uniref:NADH:ubiquinone reductase (Na(+)-transporting) subunit C n=1 Tax=Limibacter armeniacum TaxID=466084 RepID=UPI002FE5B761
MQQSNGYIIGFAVAMTVILGGLLSFTAVSLKPRQQHEIELDTKKQILASVGITGEDKMKLSNLFDEKVEAVVVNAAGEQVDYSGNVLKLNVQKEWKKKNAAEKLLPVYKVKGDDGKVSSYIFPVYGYGLWNEIWGYVALEADLNTVKGVVFDHKGETPGLGARIASEQIQDRYVGKKIKDNSDLKGVVMLKGEGNANVDDYHVDGMSGATLTANGLNKMVVNYMELYKSYMSKAKGTAAVLN